MQPRFKPPWIVLGIAAVLVIIALILKPLIDGLPVATQTDNVLLTGVPFILSFIALIFAFVFVIAMAAQWLNGRISRKLYNWVERFIIACVAIGLIGLLQLWSIVEVLPKPTTTNPNALDQFYGGFYTAVYENFYKGFMKANTAFPFQYGFLLLLFAFIAFNVWTHITPAQEKRDEAVQHGAH